MALPRRAPLGGITSNITIGPPSASAVEKSKPKYHIDDEICQNVTISCADVRAKILKFLATGEMKVGEFQRAIGVSPTYGSFVKKTGAMGGAGSTVYGNVFAFFKLKELNGENRKKKVKVGSEGEKREKEKKEAEGEDFIGLVLDGEEEGEVPVFDSCDEVRRKINHYLAKIGTSKAGFGSEIGKLFGGEEEKKISSRSVTQFLGKRGPMAGNTTSVYYGAYAFFEKIRVRDGKPMIEHKEIMEDVWDGCDPRFWRKEGVDRSKVIDRIGYITFAGGPDMYQNENGKRFMGY